MRAQTSIDRIEQTVIRSTILFCFYTIYVDVIVWRMLTCTGVYIICLATVYCNTPPVYNRDPNESIQSIFECMENKKKQKTKNPANARSEWGTYKRQDFYNGVFPVARTIDEKKNIKFENERNDKEVKWKNETFYSLMYLYDICKFVENSKEEIY